MAPGAIEELLLPMGQGIRSGAYGPTVLIVETSDDASGDYVQSLAERNGLSMFVLRSLKEPLTSARPVGAVTLAEAQTLDMMGRVGGEITSSGFARLAGIEISAAVNRLSGLSRKGYIYRLARSRREGDIYVDPRVAAHEASSSVAGGLVIESEGFITGEGQLSQLASAFNERLTAMSSSRGSDLLRTAFEAAPKELGRVAPGVWRRRVARDGGK